MSAAAAGEARTACWTGPASLLGATPGMCSAQEQDAGQVQLAPAEGVRSVVMLSCQATGRGLRAVKFRGCWTNEPSCSPGAAQAPVAAGGRAARRPGASTQLSFLARGGLHAAQGVPQYTQVCCSMAGIGTSSAVWLTCVPAWHAAHDAAARSCRRLCALPAEASWSLLSPGTQNRV